MGGGVTDERTCRGCKRGDPCDRCDGSGCGACIKTGYRHYFNEALEHIYSVTPDEADDLRDRAIDSMRGRSR